MFDHNEPMHEILRLIAIRPSRKVGILSVALSTGKAHCPYADVLASRIGD